ncbi:MAG TPA: hypothetical protein PK854_09410 [Oscillospiraceae bacterium]|nr:hypothetical protein [Oscillospiraceae bacterium]HPS35471.1 hypothetical protein [Oscillospiraceae bacterium]
MDFIKNQINITISFWAVAALGAAVCIDRAAVFILLCAIIHELGHLFFCLLLHAPIEEFNLTIIGIGLIKSRVSSQWEIMITAAGPLFGLLFAAVAYIGGYRTIGAYSLILSAINLLPVPPLDGDRILREILPPTAILLINICILLILLVFGIYISINYLSFTTLFFSLLMICSFFGKYSQNISSKMFRDLHRKF